MRCSTGYRFPRAPAQRSLSLEARTLADMTASFLHNRAVLYIIGREPFQQGVVSDAVGDHRGGRNRAHGPRRAAI